MPGINLVCSFERQLQAQDNNYAVALEKTAIDGLETKTLFKNDLFHLSCTTHAAYSVRVFERDGLLICLEGRVYNIPESQLDDQLASISRDLFANKDEGKKRLTDWLLETDGDFVVLAYESRSGRLLFFNDLFSRLPIYMSQSSRGVVLSRSFRFVAAMNDKKEFDVMAIAQFMLLRYSLGDRTYLKNVCRLRPAEWVLIDTAKPTVERAVLHVFNFDSKKYADRSAKKNAGEMAALFEKACADRARAGHQPIVSLSGGFDSRSIAAALERSGSDFSAATMLDVNGIAAADYKIAEIVSQALKCEWIPFKTEPTRPMDILRILRLKGGMVYLGKVHSIQLLDAIRQRYGNKVSFFVGLGGDRMVHDIRPSGVKTVEELIDYAMSHDKFVPMQIVSQLTGISREEMVAEFRKEFQSYPEHNIAQKYVHFHIYGQVIKWLVESCDRYSCFFNSAAPFLSPKFFDYVMNCPEDQKTCLFLYTNFLYQLNPAMARIPFARNGFLTPINVAHYRFPAWHFCMRMQKSLLEMKKAIKLRPPKIHVQKYTHSSDRISCIKDQALRLSQTTDVFDTEALHNLAYDELDDGAVSNIFTITSMMEQLVCPDSSIERYLQQDLGSFKPIMTAQKSIGNF